MKENELNKPVCKSLNNVSQAINDSLNLMGQRQERILETLKPISLSIPKLESPLLNFHLENVLPKMPKPIMPELPKLPQLPKPIMPTLPKSVIPQLSVPLIPDLPKPIIPNISNSVVSEMVSVSENFGKSLINISNKLSDYKIDFGIASAVKAVNSSHAISIAESFQNVISNLSSALLEVTKSPFIQWIQTVDFSPFLSIVQNIDFAKFDSTLSERLNEKYLQTMYECKWFPYAGWIADLDLFVEVIEILDTSRGISKRCEKRIDDAILSYYTKSKIKQIKREWRNSNLEPHVKKALGQVLESYLRKEYALVIPFLATLWEGIIKEKTNMGSKMQCEEIKKLVDENGFDDIFSDFYIKMIIGPCYSAEDVIDGIPNRHGVAHSWYVKYPSQKSALNAILLTDFLLKLEPKTDNRTKG